MSNWYYGIAENKQGPFTLFQMQQLVATGQLGPQTLVWADHMPNWVPVHTLPFLMPQRPAGDAGLGLLIPMGPQSGFAIAAGYCGLLGIIFAITAPLGVVFGILALRDIARNPQKAGKGRAITGIVLGGLLTLMWLVILLAIVAVHH